MSNLILGFLLFFIGQGIVWFQINGQFLWPFFKNNPLLIAFTLGSVASFVFIKATYYTVVYFDGLLWPGRFITFASGILIFAALTYYLMGEGINIKTGISLLLSVLLITIQIFLK